MPIAHSLVAGAGAPTGEPDVHPETYVADNAYVSDADKDNMADSRPSVAPAGRRRTKANEAWRGRPGRRASPPNPQEGEKRMRDTIGIGDTVAISMGRGGAVTDGVGVRGHVHVQVTGPDGELKDERHVHNLVATAGKAHIADQLSSSPAGAAMSHMAVGTGTVDPAVGDTTLGTEIDRNALTSRTDAGAVVTYVGTWAAGDATNSAITEGGIFNAASSGTMLARAEWTAIDKAAGDTLTVTWTVTFS